MKKLIATIFLSLAVILPAMARNEITTNVNVLPAAAQTMLKKYFPKTKVNHIKIDKKTFGGRDYDVVLTNGTEVEFDSEGNWKEVNCGINQVPAGLILKSIQNYVKNNFKGAKIVSIEVEKDKYELKLSNGLEAEFDRAGNFRKVDY